MSRKISNDSAQDHCAVRVIPVDEAGFAFYLQHYKPFRLAALQQDPAAFGSTHAREVAFGDEDWRHRLYNPLAQTFVAVRQRDQQILAATTLFGPLGNPEPVTHPSKQGIAPSEQQGATDDFVHLQVTGVYTRPEARRQGLGQALLKAAVAAAFKTARQLDKRCKLSVVVYTSNTAAIAFYEQSGFVTDTTSLGVRPEESSRCTKTLYYYD